MMRALVVLLCGLVPLSAAAAQSAAPSPLEVFGFEAGAHLREVATTVRETDGGRLRCDRSRLDARVDECRATLTVTQVSTPLELWMSAIDSVSGVLTLAGNLAPDEFDALRSSLERRFGRVDATVQGQQWMMQWVKSGRMLRLTWKVQQGAKSTSVSLVDGKVLDNWQAPRRGAPAKSSPPAKGKKADPGPAMTAPRQG
ncbi:MAG TPA: hypothetical protein VFX50_15530 [Gemmatimonadales bacterium]|nr:hypothetical protein [Gemmatimonadales bacterium]